MSEHFAQQNGLPFGFVVELIYSFYGIPVLFRGKVRKHHFLFLLSEIQSNQDAGTILKAEAFKRIYIIAVGSRCERI